MGYAILAALLVIAAGGWAIEWFRASQLSAYLALKRVPSPTVEEWEKCAKIVLKYIFRRKK